MARRIGWLALVGIVCGVVGSAGAQKWKIPNPDSAVHPGADTAPASDPRTYPDPKGFAGRADMTIAGLAMNDLGNWRKGYFAGGDPGKYLPGPAMAKLLKNPADPEPRKYMNDDRSCREHYHFAAVNWARFYPLFREALTPAVRTEVAKRASTYTSYHSGGGTENHKVMWRTAACVLPLYLEGGRIGRMGKDAVLRKQKAWLTNYVKGLYAGGQGEWDSSTYLMFDVNGMLNVYDFATDPEVRLLAKAALDWYVTAYALKYTDGCYTAPNQRGFTAGPVDKIADRTGWVWWGSNKSLTPERLRGSLYAMHAITSSYRPNKVICNIATRNLPVLPFESRNSKPNYWGVAGQPQPNRYRETVYATKHYTMGSLWNGHGGQMTRFQLVAATPNGGMVFTGGSPRGSDHRGKMVGLKFTDGGGRFDQSCQVGGTYLSMSDMPASETEGAYSFFCHPGPGWDATRKGGWVFVQAGGTYMAFYPLAGKAEKATSPPIGKGSKAKSVPIIRFPGRRTGFLLETGDADAYKSQAAFAAAVLANQAPDVTLFKTRGTVRYTNLAGRAIEMTYQTGAGQAAVQTDSKAVSYDNWAVYDGPYVKQSGGVLTVNDGRDGFIVDFSGDMPVYKPWTK